MLNEELAAELLADDRMFLDLYVRQAACGGYPGAPAHAAHRIPVLLARIAHAEKELAAAGEGVARDAVLRGREGGDHDVPG